MKIWLYKKNKLILPLKTITNNKNNNSMSPKQFDQIFQANIEKITRAMNSEVCHTKAFFRTNPNRRNETFLYVIAPVDALVEYQDADYHAKNATDEHNAYLALQSVGKFFKTQPEAVRWIESL